MNPEDALNLVDQVWKQVPLVHDVNLKVQEAIKVLRDEIAKNNKKEE